MTETAQTRDKSGPHAGGKWSECKRNLNAERRSRKLGRLKVLLEEFPFSFRRHFPPPLAVLAVLAVFSCFSVRCLKSLPSSINILGRKCFSGRQEELAPARSAVVTSLRLEIFHCQPHSAVSRRLSKPISRPVSPPQLPPSLRCCRRAHFLFLTLQDVAPARSLGAHGNAGCK